MKIGLVRHGYSATGGAESYLLRFARGLEEQGHSCVLFSDREWPAAAWADAGKNREMRVLKRAGKSPGAFADRLEQSRPKNDCDFLFSLERVWNCDCYRAGDGVHAAWLSRRARFEPRWRSRLRRLNSKHSEIVTLEKNLFSPGSKTHVIANADFVKQEMMEIYKTPSDRITVIHNGFDPPDLTAEQRSDYREKGRAAYQLDPETTIFLFVGTGWFRKGLRFAIDAVESLAGKGRKVRLLVAGNDSRRPITRRKDTVWFLGPASASELTRLYEAADVFILPTLYDPFSNASLEAASHGLPIITTSSNGICELWPDLDGSVVASPDDPGLGAACTEWLDLERRTAARHRNRESAALHSVEKNVSESLACFERLIQQGQTGD